MNQQLLSYTLKAGVALAFLYLLYRLLLSRLTFYRVNRYFLLGFSLLSLLAPLLYIHPFLPTKVNSYVEQTFDPVSTPFNAAPPVKEPAPTVIQPVHHFDKTGALEMLLLAGMAFMLVRLTIQVLSLSKARKRATLVSKEGGIRLYSTLEPTVPFSFGQSIYVHTSAYAAEDLERIIQHETVHIRERHWMDILFFQVLLVLQWWNPLAWVLDRASRQNLEFLADKAVLEHGIDRKQYQYLLLKVAGLSAPPLCNGFNFSPLKNRIIMMNKQRSSRFQSWRFLLALPAVVLLLTALRRHPAPQYPMFHYIGFAVDSRTLEPIEGATVTEKKTGRTATTDTQGFFRIDVPFVSSSQKQSFIVTAHKEGRLDAHGGMGLLPGDTSPGVLMLMGLPLQTDTTGRNTPWGTAASSDDTSYTLSTTETRQKALDELVEMARTSKMVKAFILLTPHIYFYSGKSSHVVTGDGSYASLEDTTALVLVNDTLMLSGPEVNRRYDALRSHIHRVGALEADEAFKKMGIRKAILEVWIDN